MILNSIVTSYINEYIDRTQMNHEIHFTFVCDFIHWVANNDVCILELKDSCPLFYGLVTEDCDTINSVTAEEDWLDEAYHAAIESLTDSMSVFCSDNKINYFKYEFILNDMSFDLVSVVMAITSHIFHDEFQAKFKRIDSVGIKKDLECIYIWEDSRSMFKIGITKWKGRRARPDNCARNRGEKIVRSFYGRVSNSRQHEKILLRFGKKCYSSGDGYTEFRELNQDEVIACVEYIKAVSVDVDIDSWS